MRRLATIAVLMISGLLPGVTAYAQSDGFAFTGINFNFTNPGARARGIGGAFVALADDSTAALANPAGLAYLEREVTVEAARDEDLYPVGQLTQGGATVRYDALTESFTPHNDPFRVWTSSREDRINYGSLVWPVKEHRMTLALYYATLADMASNFTVGPGVICVRGGTAGLPGAGQPCTMNLLNPLAEYSDPYFGQQVSYSLSTRLAGAASGIRVNDRLSLGLSLAAAETRFEGTAFLDREALIPGQGNAFQRSTVDDTDLVYSVGVLYRADLWGVGLSYRSASSFTSRNQWLEADGSLALDRPVPDGELTVPERLAGGLALSLGDAWVVVGEVDWVPYSEVLADMPPFNSSAAADGADISYRISDVTEYHLGVEYTTFAERRGWSVRLGYWRDTIHLPWVAEPYSDATDPADSLRARESLVRARFDQHVHHFTGGVGLSDGRRVRLDLAVDFTEDEGTDALLSAVVYF